MTKTEISNRNCGSHPNGQKNRWSLSQYAQRARLQKNKRNGEFLLPGFGKLVKQKRKARIGINPKTQQKIKIPAKTVVKFRVPKAARDGILG
jgi:DNA-binding protein HU-beta